MFFAELFALLRVWGRPLRSSNEETQFLNWRRRHPHWQFGGFHVIRRDYRN